MRASDLTEARASSLRDDVSRALPAAYYIPKLKNQDPYKQYRFGVAIAAAKGRSARIKDGENGEFEPESIWGENEIIVSYDPHVADWIDDALKMVGLSSSDKKLLGTPTSEEATDVAKNSPVKAFKGYPR